MNLKRLCYIHPPAHNLTSCLYPASFKIQDWKMYLFLTQQDESCYTFLKLRLSAHIAGTGIKCKTVVCIARLILQSEKKYRKIYLATKPRYGLIASKALRLQTSAHNKMQSNVTIYSHTNLSINFQPFN